MSFDWGQSFSQAYSGSAINWLKFTCWKYCKLCPCFLIWPLPESHKIYVNKMSCRFCNCTSARNSWFVTYCVNCFFFFPHPDGGPQSTGGNSCPAGPQWDQQRGSPQTGVSWFLGFFLSVLTGLRSSWRFSLCAPWAICVCNCSVTTSQSSPTHQLRWSRLSRQYRSQQIHSELQHMGSGGISLNILPFILITLI